MKTRHYPVPGADVMQPAQLVRADLARDHEVRLMPIIGQPGVMMEVRRMGSVLQGTGIHRAVLKVWFQPQAQGFVVTVGTADATNATKGAVEWLLNAPAMITDGYAAFKQAQVDERVFRCVEHWVTNVARVPIRGAAPVPNAQPCPSCRTPLPYGARFCPRCAHDTQSAGVQAACASCKGAIALDAQFCPHCGQKASASSACPKCGEALEPGAAFCSGCGHKQLPIQESP